jgi:hypothetical protein
MADGREEEHCADARASTNCHVEVEGMGHDSGRHQQSKNNRHVRHILSQWPSATVSDAAAVSTAAILA